MKRSPESIKELKKMYQKTCEDSTPRAKTKVVSMHIPFSEQKVLGKQRSASKDHLAERMSEAIITILPKVIRRIIERDEK